MKKKVFKQKYLDFQGKAFTPELLSTFPVVDDFSIELFKTEKFGLNLRFVSPSLGELTSFPWWDHVDKTIRAQGMKFVPMGTVQRTFDDQDQGWHVVIFREGDDMFILEGEEVGGYDRWYRTPHARYKTEWAKIMRQLNVEE